ncbi:unnamed protein product [Penicillium camemberti]|uniref:Str. FM013 n=1 Tax=Penicillium camemberti (strain FM 013) TaxID=1429867 RepID=A0A0G4P6C3_PENC3|nr:unnamed protein product [Penicillium camemberti]
MHHLALLNYRTPYDRLVYLKARFARSSAYEEEIHKKVYNTRDLIESFRAMNREVGVQTITSTTALKSAFST